MYDDAISSELEEEGAFCTTQCGHPIVSAKAAGGKTVGDGEWLWKSYSCKDEAQRYNFSARKFSTVKGF